MNIFDAIRLVKEGVDPINALRLCERRVRSATWTPAAGSKSFKVIELLALNPGLNTKQIASELNVPQSSAYHAIVGNQDAGLIASLGGKLGYVLTQRGAEFAKQKGIRASAASSELTAQATAKAEARKLPKEIENAEALQVALGNYASSSPLGKRARNRKSGDLGFAFKKSGDTAQWTVTLKGSEIGAKYDTHEVWMRDRKSNMQVLNNESFITSIAISVIQKALESLKIQGGVKTIKVVGWQADKTMEKGSGDIVFTFDSALPPVPEKAPKEKASPDQDRKRLMKRAQRLIKRAAKGTRLASLSRAMKIVQRLQNA